MLSFLLRVWNWGQASQSILLKNPLAKACFMLIDVERRMIFHCGSAWQ
jgi:hypothetical protein